MKTTMHALLNQQKPAFEAAVDYLQKELSTLRTGRATPVLVEDIPCSAYDSTMEVKGLASITAQDAKTLIIDPWDKALLPNIEKGIRDAGIGLSPVVDGEVIRIVIPPMTEENRKQMAKVAKEKLEEARIKIRSVREGIRDTINKKEKDKEVSEDEKFKLFDELDKLTKEYSDKVGEIGKAKEDEILTV